MGSMIRSEPDVRRLLHCETALLKAPEIGRPIGRIAVNLPAHRLEKALVSKLDGGSEWSRFERIGDVAEMTRRSCFPFDGVAGGALHWKYEVDLFAAGGD